MTQAWPQRLWELRKAMAVIERELDQARTRAAALEQAQRDEPARFDAFGGRIAALEARLKTLIPQVAALREQQQQATQTVAIRALEGEQARLAGYTRQARYAIAQLYDHAAVAATRKDGDEAR
jgi:predicted  nucleic acid-binding Zn-ribbon protein